jgi:Arc/MetJ-type ribon-helix-helix transcriptional regulator
MGREHLQPVNAVGDTSGGYSPTKFWHRSSDTNGHSMDARVTMPKFWRGQIEEAVEARQFPYRTMADFIRDAVWHRLQWCREELKDTHPDLAMAYLMENVEADVDAFTWAAKKADEMVNKLEGALAIARAGGDTSAFARTLGKVEMHAMDMSEPTRSRLMEKIEHYRRVIG